MSFESLALHPALARAVADAGYTAATEVQSRAIPAARAGHDLMVSAATGSGKTAAFVLPALERVLAGRDGAPPPAAAQPRGRKGRGGPRARVEPTSPRVLVLTPTRELAMQVAAAAGTYGGHVPHLRVATVVGGVPYGAQLRALQDPDLLIATPGRLIDLMESGAARLDAVELLVLDEADRMLDLGFIDPIRHIAAALPAARQTLMTSATFAGAVGQLATQLLREPQRIEVATHRDAHADIEQRLHWADDGTHKDALLDHILAAREIEQAIVFTSTQRDAELLADRLAEFGHAVAALHGGMPQGRRNRVLQALRQGRLRVLVATDVAARGIDVPRISHVINYGLPMKEEDYVHRIGRTGRAGRAGLAVTLAERRDFGMIQRIQRFTTQRIPAAVIGGLEPRRPEPKPLQRPGGPRGADRRGGGWHDARPGFRPEGRPGPRAEGWPGPHHRQDGAQGPRPEGSQGHRAGPRPDGRPGPRADGRPGPWTGRAPAAGPRGPGAKGRPAGPRPARDRRAD